MRTVHYTRRTNTRDLIDEVGGPTAFAQRIKRDPAYISHIAGTSPSKTIGDRMARHIEQCLNKPEGWLDEPHAATEASPTEDHTEVGSVTLRIVRIAKNDAGEAALTTAGHMEGVPRRELDRVGIKEDEAILVEIHGNAHGLALPDGSLVAANTTDTEPREGKLYALRDAELLRVRILVPQPGGGLILRAFNRDDYPDEALSQEQVAERIEVLGKVFWSASSWS